MNPKHCRVLLVSLLGMYCLAGNTSAQNLSPDEANVNSSIKRSLTFTTKQPKLSVAIGSEPSQKSVRARTVMDFLNSLGVVTSMPHRGQLLSKTISMINYAGFTWVRTGIEGLTEDGPTTIDSYLNLNRNTNVKFSWGLVSGGTDIAKLIKSAKVLAKNNALLAIEGNNEPNNWSVTYEGQVGGGDADTWMPVARLQRNLYAEIKNDPDLWHYPVWSISEAGAQKNNTGLQFLTIPAGADTLMPNGTVYADFANLHNYIYHSKSPDLEDNKTWNASDPGASSKVDGLYGNHGKTWHKGFNGYSESQLVNLPRVTTETGLRIGGQITEKIHGLNLLTIYFSQFKRGYKHTAVYLLRDRTDERGNQKYGFFRPDYTPRLAAHYLHNLTEVLKDEKCIDTPGYLNYRIEKTPATVHDILLQGCDRKFKIILWNEVLDGSDRIQINFENQLESADLYYPIETTTPKWTLNNVRNINISLTNHPVILSLTP